MPDEELPDLISSLDPSSGGTIKFDDLLGWFKKMNAAAAPDEMNVITENKDQINKEDAAKAASKKKS